MGEAKQRKESAGLTRFIEASDQERMAIHLVIENFVRAKGGNQSRSREMFRQLRLKQIVALTAKLEAAAEVEARRFGPNERPKPIRIAQFKDDLVEYEMTNDAIEYMTKTFEEIDIPLAWLVYTGEVTDRMTNSKYVAPSQVATAEAAAPTVTPSDG